MGSLISNNSTLIIETDALRTGWGGGGNGVRTGGPWSPQKQQMHINCLEPLGSTLGSEVLCQEKEQPHHLAEDGQHVGTDIHQ